MTVPMQSSRSMTELRLHIRQLPIRFATDRINACIGFAVVSA